MDTQTVEILKIVLPDAIKILGPALITGLIAYWTARIQYKSKLEEITGNQQFKSRELLLDYYKKKIDDANKSSEDLNKSLGKILGFAAALNLDEDITDHPHNLNKIMPHLSFVELHIRSCDFEIKTTLRDMEGINLKNSEEFSKLVKYQEIATSLTHSQEFDKVKANIFKLLEIYSFIARCSQLVLESQIQRLFSHYIKNA